MWNVFIFVKSSGKIFNKRFIGSLKSARFEKFLDDFACSVDDYNFLWGCYSIFLSKSKCINDFSRYVKFKGFEVL